VGKDLQPAPVERASYPARDGNRVRVLIDGSETFAAIGERVRSASRSIWITVSFVDLDFRLPDGPVPFLDELDAAASRGVDVRLLFWWSEFPGIGSFRGDAAELEEMALRGVRVKMRWDHVPRGCHHQKSYVVDGEVAYVGGINLTADGLSTREHTTPGHHDVFAEIEGPAVADVAENFAQRWNQASRFDGQGHAFPSTDAAGRVNAAATPEDRGSTTVQLVRTIRRGLYRGGRGWSPAHGFDLADGEQSVQDAVHRWIEAARTLIYIENQYLLASETLALLAQAAARGVDVIVVAPYRPDPNLVLYPKELMAETRAALDALAGEKRFGLFGLLRPGNDGEPIYVHSKVMIVDDELLSIGSANLWPPSYNRDSELALCVWDPRLARTTRGRLWAEHLGDAGHKGLDDWRRLAHERTPPVRVVAIDPASYYRFAGDAVAPWSGIEPRD
jgi:phosphatidylserine/phosphatidylglycerophosphate/cardiolipin synthase-like enzyme